jgi:tetratricopeptide (TPR) repeat protein
VGKASRRKNRVARGGRTDRGGSTGAKALDASTIFQKRLVHIVLIAAFALLAYSNTFHIPLLFDGGPQIVDNPIIKDLKNFTSDRKGYNYNPRRFIGYLSFALNYHFGGPGVVGYHIVNLLIHIGNALLIYFLVVLTFRTSLMRQSADSSPPAALLIALFSALLFVSHPLQTQAVTYVVQRFASLTTFFYLLSLVMYIRGRLSSRQAGKLASFFCSLLSAVLAMKTKEIAFTLPIMIAFYEFTFFRSSRRKKLLFLLPVLLTLFIIPLSVMHSGKPLGEILSDVSRQTRIQTQMPRWEYLLTEMRVIVTYIRLIFLPVNQNLDYDYPLYHSLFTPSVIFSVLFLMAILGLAVYLIHKSRQADRQQAPNGKQLSAISDQQEEKTERDNPTIRQADTSAADQPSTKLEGRRAGSLPPTSNLQPDAPYYRLIFFGILWFFITLSVESSIIPIVDVIFEHRLYLPLAGVFIGITTVLMIAAERLRVEKVVIPTLVLITLVLSGLTYARNTAWKDGISLWQDAVMKSPNKLRPHYELGLAYLSKGQLDKATSEFQTAVRLKPDYAEAHINLGVAYKAQGQWDKAIAEYQAASRLKPDYAEAYNNLGVAYASQGRLDRAIAEYQRALRLKPGYAEAHYNLGIIYESQGRVDGAIAEYQAALRLKPDYTEVYLNLGTVYETQGQWNRAIAEYQAALRLKPDYAEAHYNLGVAYASQGRLDEATVEFQAAVRLKPDYAEAHINLGVAYASQGQWNRAITEYRTALRLKPDYLKAHYNLGVAYESLGEWEKAIAEYQMTLRLKPDLHEARRHLDDIVSRRARVH